MKRIGLSRLSALQAPVPVVRYERQSPGELLHIDIKKLGRIRGVGHRITGDRTLNRNRGIGWDAVHLAIDDHSRVSPSHKCCLTRQLPVAYRSCAKPWLTTRVWAFASSG